MGTKRIIRTLLWALVLLALSVRVLLLAGETREAYGGISLRIEDTPVSGGKLKRLMARETGGLRLNAAWSRGRTEAVTAPDTHGTARIRPIAVYGDVRQVCPMKLLSGDYLLEDDASGCLITGDVSMQLFHSVDAVGARVLISGKAYTVRGILTAYEPMAIFRSEDGRYENLEFTPGDLSNGAAELEAFCYRHGLTDDYVIVENGLYGRLLLTLAFLPVSLAFLLTAAAFFHAFFRERKKPAALLYLLPAAASVILLWLTLRDTFYWPQKYLPTKCSDFGYWSGLIADWRETWRAITLAAPLPKELQLFQPARRILWGTCLLFVLEGALYANVLALTGLRQKDA